MRILLDTHVYLWHTNNDKKLSKKARTLIDNATEVYVSSASIWESVIKIKLGKLDVSLDELVMAITSSGFIQLPITAEHAAAVGNLPDYHKDPFDRILIAQAITEPLTFLTADESLRDYSDLIILI